MKPEGLGKDAYSMAFYNSFITFKRTILIYLKINFIYDLLIMIIVNIYLIYLNAGHYINNCLKCICSFNSHKIPVNEESLLTPSLTPSPI